jgi:hypothetical protein
MSKKYRYERLKPGDLEASQNGFVVMNESNRNIFQGPDLHGDYHQVKPLIVKGDVVVEKLDGNCAIVKLDDLYRRVEVEEQRKPRKFEVFYETEMKLGIILGPETRPHNVETFKVREVIPPEKKELPDCEGWWQVDSPDNHPVNIRFSDSVPIGNLGSPVSKGRWIKLDDLIKQAWKDAE